MLLELPLHLLALVISGRLAVQGKQSAQVELGGLEELDLADVDLEMAQQKKLTRLAHTPIGIGTLGKNAYVLQGVDALGGLLNLTTNHLGDELVGELRQSAAGGLTLNDLSHLLANGADLRRAGVGGLLDLVGASLGEGNGKQAEQVVISSLHGDVGLDQGLPLADQGAQLISGEVQTVEVGQTVLALNLVDAELDLAERVVLIILEVGEGDLEDTAFQRVVGILQTAGAVDQSLADTSKVY